MIPRNIFAGLTILLLSTALHALDEPRDFYAEPGLNRFQTGMGQDSTENINNFNGHLQLRYADLTIPGNGGLNITVNRFYNMPQGMAGYDDVVGLGWSMHHGRITVPSGYAANICNLTASDFSNHNPSLELPDGSRDQFFVSSVLNTGALVTKSNWKAECIDPENYLAGLRVTAPNGVTYRMDVYLHLQGEPPQPDTVAPSVETWYPSRVEDLRGNYLEFIYGAISGSSLNAGLKYLTEIVASDDRHVYYEYLDENDAPVSGISKSARISAVRANGQVLRYEYTVIGEAMPGWGGLRRYQLSKVTRPDNASWQYEYYGDALDIDNYLALSKVTYPTGGKIVYEYQRYRPYPPNGTFYIRALQTKQQLADTETVHAEWRYSFSPGGAIYEKLDGVNDLPVDVVNVTTPEGLEKFYYFGYQTAANKYDVLFQIGLEIRHDIYDLSGNLVQGINKGWINKRKVSSQPYKNGILTALFDLSVWQADPSTERRWTVSDVPDTGYITKVDYLDYDDFGNHGKKVEFSFLGGVPNINTVITYFNDTSSWIIGLQQAKQLSWEGDVTPSSESTKQYNAYGELVSHNQNGVTTLYEYDSEGDLFKVTDARLNTTTYLDYYRGLAQTEQYPDSTSITREVNPSGTVAAETSARGFTTRFQYDGLNRLTNIQFPLGQEVAVSWLPNTRTLTRGNYQEQTVWDSYGRPAEFVRADLGVGSSFQKHFEYDVLGRKVFESDPNSALGVRWTYDRLSRVTRTELQDGSFTRSVYKSPFEVDRYDEKNNITTMAYRIFGHEDNVKQPYWILTPDAEMTIFDHDILGNLSEVFRGKQEVAGGQFSGYATRFFRDPKYFLIQEYQPGLSRIYFERDEVGNMISRSTDSSATTRYIYDKKNRLTSIDYPAGTPDVTLTYDPDGSIKSSISNSATRTYGYDNNGNLVSEALSIEGVVYNIAYGINPYDQISSITYPSGRVIDQAPDVFGRPTKIGAYATNVNYDPSGTVKDFTYGNGIVANYRYTPRHWADQLNIGGTHNIVGLDYTYEGNGNIQAIVDNVEPSENRSMTYDGQDRLKTVDGAWGQSVFDYDEFGNLLYKSTPGNLFDSQAYEYSGMLLVGLSFPQAPGYTHRFVYDDYDNVVGGTIYDSLYNAVSSVTNQFDAAQNLIRSTRTQLASLTGPLDPLNSGSFNSTYDGQNNRVSKTDHKNGDKKTHYVYAKSGQLLGEYLANGAIYGHEYFYLNNQLVASIKTPAPRLALAGNDFATCAGKPTTLSGGYTDAEMKVSSFAWTQLSGPVVALTTPSQQSTSFVPVLSSVNQQYVFRFSITDTAGGKISDDVTVSAAFDCPPVANAGVDFYALGGSHLWLDGTASLDYQGPVSFSWNSADFSILVPNVARAKAFAADDVSSYTGVVGLTVTDNTGNTAVDNVVVTVLPRNVDVDSDGLPDNWEWIYFGNIALYDGAADPDGDGFTNAQELAAETDPTKINPPDAVEQLTVIPGSTRSTLVWKPSSLASSYSVYWTTDPAQSISSWTKVDTSKNYLDHIGLVNGTNYFYAVMPLNANGAGPVSVTVSGTPNVRGWIRQAQALPDALAIDPLKAIVTANRFGDTLVIYEEAGADIRRLLAWRYSIFTGWASPEVVSESAAEFKNIKAAIDVRGNALVTWLRNASGRDDLWSNRYVAGTGWGLEFLLENYNGDTYYGLTGSVSGVADIKFADDGSGVVCWRQNDLFFANNWGYQNAISAFSRFMSSDGTWQAIVRMEDVRNIGFTYKLSCDLAADGKEFVSIWERHTNYSPGDFLSSSTGNDIWFSRYSSGTGWSLPHTLDAALGEVPGDASGFQFYAPSAALDAATGSVLAVWKEGRNPDPQDIHSMVYNLASQSWSDHEVIASRVNSGNFNVIPKLAMEYSDGGAVASWKGSSTSSAYTYKQTRSSGWSRAKALPDGNDLVDIDVQGLPVSVGSSLGKILASRLVGTSWSTVTASEGTDTRTKTLLDVNLDGASNMLLHWTAGADLLVAEQRPGAGSGGVPPIANAGADKSVPEGSLAVALDGSASTDPDGSIDAYRWEQIAGTPVSIQASSSAVASFNAPTVTADESLTFRLTVTDAQGNTSVDDLVVRVTNAVADTTPPVTTLTSTRTLKKGVVSYSLTLSANESGVTWYRVLGGGVITSGGTNTGDFQTYSGPIGVNLDKSGQVTFRYYSVDTAGNVEAWREVILQ